ncbi:MAG: translation elongation factor Ts [Chloroflexota bacterium]|nr:translation elongation factor Ts [Chloroflexota bacterium]
MAVSMEQVRELRERTGAGILDCKKVLEETNGDMKQALAVLREKGLKVADKKKDRVANEGRIDVYIHTGNKMAAMVEVNCETDFVARNDEFVKLVKELALHIASNPDTKYITTDEVPAGEAEAYDAGTPKEYIQKTVLMEQPFVRNPSETIQEMVRNTIAKTGENIVVRRFTRYEIGA